MEAEATRKLNRHGGQPVLIAPSFERGLLYLTTLRYPDFPLSRPSKCQSRSSDGLTEP